MPWARLDDMLPVHPKVRGLSDASFRLYICAICWSNLHMTDGKIPGAQLRFVSDVRAPKQRADELVTAGLWDITDDGWQIHDYLEYQPSAEKVRRERVLKAERMDRWRSNRDASVDASQDASRDAAPIPSHPIPSPDGSVSANPAGSNGHRPDLVLIRAVQQAIADRTGADVPDAHAQTVAAQIIGRENVRNPVPYVTAAISRDPNPRRFLPTRTPPPLQLPPRRSEQDAITKSGATLARDLLTTLNSDSWDAFKKPEPSCTRTEKP